VRCLQRGQIHGGEQPDDGPEDVVIRIPLYLAIAQWALLLCLALLLIAAYRQLGRVAGQSGTPPELGPRTGDRPGRIGYERLSPAASGAQGRGVPDGGVSDGGVPGRGAPDGVLGRALCTFVPGGEPALVAFVDPTCPSCEELVAALGRARESGELAAVRVLLLTTDPPAYLQISAAFRATALEIGRPLDDAELEPYRPSATPLVVAMDAAGVVRAAGTAARQSEVRAMISASMLPPSAELLPVV
jgi:hypothetical protein